MDDPTRGADAEQVALVVAEDRGVGENVDAVMLCYASGERLDRFGRGHFTVVDVHAFV